MKLFSRFNILVFCSLLLSVVSAPVQEARPSRRHNLGSDKELLRKKLEELEKELHGRRSEEEILQGHAAAQDLADQTQYKDAANPIWNSKEEEFGEFLNKPFSDDQLGQVPETELDDNDLKAMLDSISIDDLKQLLNTLKQNKQAADEESQSDDGDDDSDESSSDSNSDSESRALLEDISVEQLKKLVHDIKQKTQDGGMLTEEDVGKIVDYLVSHLSIQDLQSMLAALKEKEKENTPRKDEMTNEELLQAIEGLLSHTDTDELQRILAALRARKQDLSSSEGSEGSDSSDNTLSDRGVEQHMTEEEVLMSLMDFLAGLSTEDLQNTILAVRRKKLAMKQAADDVAALYTRRDEDDGNDDDDDDDEDGSESNSDSDSSSDLSDEWRPCDQEKQDILQKIEAARLAGNHFVGGDVPNCDEDGYYAPKQCSGSMCYCVDKHGTATEGEAMIWEAASLICSQEKDVKPANGEPATDDAPTDGIEDEDEQREANEDKKVQDEDSRLEQAERDLLEMLRQQKRRQQETKSNERLNM